MTTDYNSILNRVKNKDFITDCFNLIQSFGISDNNFKALTDAKIANAVIKKRNKYTYPIAKEIAANEKITTEITHVNGSRRYYNDIFRYKDKCYLLSNDWYYPSEGKKNTKDTRTPFIEWLRRIEKESNLQC
ncbi:hypothetical protein AGMMS50229_11750 [Campylobacterota bacterium]|nr:hypothetical protein AGMMS50229_11750 [Campylobacterota bacterium]